MKVELQKAQQAANELVRWLRPYCQRLEIAGSVRRERPEVKDIELVAVPAWKETGLFGGEHTSQLLARLADLTERGHLSAVKGGDKYAQYELPTLDVDCRLDLFMVEPASFGYQFAIRTGPWTFSKRLVTNRRYGGRLHDDTWCQDGKVIVRRDSELCPADAPPGLTFGVQYPTPEERDFLELAGGWVEPRERI